MYSLPAIHPSYHLSVLYPFLRFGLPNLTEANRVVFLASKLPSLLPQGIPSLSLSLSLSLSRSRSRSRSRSYLGSEMGFVSFVGRVLFVSVFLLSAYQEIIEFGSDGGPAVKVVAPKYEIFMNHVSSHLGIRFPEIEVKHIIALTIVLKGLGGLLFIFSSYFGACLLLLYLLLVTLVMFDFYNYKPETPEFAQLLVDFTKNLAFFGALLFFIGMKNSMLRKKQPKTSPKTKTT